MTDKPLILAVETSGRTGSVAAAAGGELLAEKSLSAPMKHSVELFEAMSNLLERFERKPKEVEQVYISIGPGSFTGLRIAATFAKIMHLANNVKIVAVDTLDVIAENTTDFTEKTKTPVKKIAAILDAKRGQFFVAAYENKGRQREKVLPDCLMTNEQFLEKFAGGTEVVWLLGEGLVYYKEKFKSQGIDFVDDSYWWPKAAKVHKLGWKMALDGKFTDALTLQPTYLQRPDIKQKSSQCKAKT